MIIKCHWVLLNSNVNCLIANNHNQSSLAWCRLHTFNYVYIWNFIAGCKEQNNHITFIFSHVLYESNQIYHHRNRLAFYFPSMFFFLRFSWLIQPILQHFICSQNTWQFIWIEKCVLEKYYLFKTNVKFRTENSNQCE